MGTKHSYDGELAQKRQLTLADILVEVLLPNDPRGELPKLDLLLQHYKIPKDGQHWLSLCLALARTHVPGFQDKPKAGRPRKHKLIWPPSEKGRPGRPKNPVLENPELAVKNIEKEKTLIRIEKKLPEVARISDKAAIKHLWIRASREYGLKPVRITNAELKRLQSLVTKARQADGALTRKSPRNSKPVIGSF